MIQTAAKDMGGVAALPKYASSEGEMPEILNVPVAFTPAGVLSCRRRAGAAARLLPPLSFTHLSGVGEA
jgi:hypothetical protein